MNPQYDNALLGILQHEGKLEKFLDAIFGFLMRRTDFYHIMTPEQKKIGFPRGVSLQMVLKIYEKYQSIYDEYQRHRETALTQQTPENRPSIPSQVEEAPIVGDQVASSKNEHASRVEQKLDKPTFSSTLPDSGDKSDELSVYQADSDCYNGANRDDYTWSQTIKDVDIKIKVPQSVRAARDVSVQIGRKHVRVLIKQSGQEDQVYFDRDLCWDIHRDEAVWTLHPKENQLHLCLDKIQERWWEAAFLGEDKINTRKIDCSRPMHELDEEAQAKIHQLMYDEHRKRQGLPTSEQEKMQKLLSDAWDKQGSPFQGIPYDPSRIKVDGSSLHIEK